MSFLLYFIHIPVMGCMSSGRSFSGEIRDSVRGGDKLLSLQKEVLYGDG